MSSNKNIPGPIQSTAGAISVRNEKGEISMQKVKVNRYVTGKRPGYAPRSSSEEESDDEELITHPVPQRPSRQDEERTRVEVRDEDLIDFKEAAKSDPRLRRLQKTEEERRRKIEEPKILDGSDEDDDDDEENERWARRHRESDSESGEEIVDDEEIERRRLYLRQRALEKIDDGELLAKEDEKESESESEASEYEEYTDSEEESRPRLKPVFVRKRERNTIKEKELLEIKEKKLEEHSRLRAEERRKETLRIVEDAIRREKGQTEDADDKDAMSNMPQLTDVNTDDENEENEYEAWKLRELKRIKRDREERETIQRERDELERLHGMTEDERRLESKLNPKVIINKATKGKYKFLQKYFHRGAFYLDKDDEIYKKDFAEPTLEDHFDKTILPKVMQVKNFGRSGRTKYTHLVDQDTTHFDSPWVAETPQNVKFSTSQAAGVKQVFTKPSFKKRKTDEI